MRPSFQRFLNAVAGVAAVLVPGIVRAQETASGAATFRQDPVDYFGTRFLTAVMIIGIIMILLSLFRYRGRLTGAMAWSLLLGGALIIPAVSSGLGTVLVFERAEHVEFCASCHLTMKYFIADMEDPKSESLAAVHYKSHYIPDDQCYECHTSYGVFGTVEAKKEGMIDVYKYYTRTFKLPVHLRHPYPNGDCLKCHAGAVKWEAAHADFEKALFDGSSHCMDCHEGMGHPAHTVTY